MSPKKSLTATGLIAASAVGALLSAPAAHADLPRGFVHAVVTCQSATLYSANPYPTGTAGKSGPVLPQGKKIAYQSLAPSDGGWVETISMGANTVGWLRVECIGGRNSW